MTALKQAPNSDFSAFRNSPNGKIEQQAIWENLQKYLNLKGQEIILDAACGQGWLSQKLQSLSPNIYACDISESLIKEAKAKNSNINFSVVDLTKPLPYENNFFDLVIWNLGIHDILEPKIVFQNFHLSLKPQGTLILTITNPYYSYPVGQWKRGLKKFLPFSKPTLKISAYNYFKKNPAFCWGQNFKNYFHTLPEIINLGLSTDFQLININEITSDKDSKTFDRNYQLYRFPMMLTLVFKKVCK